MDSQQPQHDPDVAVDVRRAGRAGGRVVMDAGPLDVGPVPRRRRVVQRQGEPLLVGDQRLDRIVENRAETLSACLPAAATVV
jgi:hypothetical protein